MDREQRTRLIWRAEALEKTTKLKGQPSGALGLTGVALLKVIAFRFFNLKVGAAWPSYDNLCEATGFARQTIANAIKRLEGADFLLVTRRAGFRGGRIARETNIYRLPEEPPALPDDYVSLAARRKPKTQESFLPWDQWSGTVKDRLEDIGRRGLEAALAGLGMAIEGSS